MTKPPSRKDDRQARLAEALRQNLRRRKDQDRARIAADGEGDDSPVPTEGQSPDTTA